MTGPTEKKTQCATHTPGPWSVGNTVPEGAIGINCGDLPKIGSVRFSQARTVEEARCNAHLIAAAPELLEELEEVTDALYRAYADDAYLDVMKSARAVINKAKGCAP